MTGYPQIVNFYLGLTQLDEQDVPYSFIRLGEDIADIETRVNWVDDMPDEIQNFEPVVDVNDDDWDNYEDVKDE